MNSLINIVLFQETLEELKKHLTLKERVIEDYNSFLTLCDVSYLDSLKERLNECTSKLDGTDKRLHTTQDNLQVNLFVLSRAQYCTLINFCT